MNKIDIPSYAVPMAEVKVVKETEKAYLVDMDTETIGGEKDLYLQVWVPKKCTMTKEEYFEEKRRCVEVFENGKKMYAALVDFCKKNNIKGARVGLRKETLLKKVHEAGLEFCF